MRPFTDSIIGSWEVVGGAPPEEEGAHLVINRIIYHFAGDGKTHWECHVDGKYWISTLGYRLSASTLTIVYSKGGERDFALQEEDGILCFPGVNDRWWRLKRMPEPQAFSKAFVGEDGMLRRLGKQD